MGAGLRRKRWGVQGVVALVTLSAGTLSWAVASPSPTSAAPTASRTQGAPPGVHSAPGAADPAATATDWTVYHHDLRGSGVDTSGTSLSPASQAWESPVLDGQLYGEPLESGGRVYVATENDTVYALSAVRWDRALAPAPRSARARW